MERPRVEILDELESLHARLKQKYNRILHEEMGHLVKELGRRNRSRHPTDSARTAAVMKDEYVRWATRHQDFLDQEANISKALAATPRETPVAFTGENAQAFWQHFTASVVENKSMDDRQRMAHLLSRVKDHRDAASLVAGFKADGTELASCLEAFRAHYLDEKLLGMAALKRAISVVHLTDIHDQLAITKFATEIRIIQSLLKDDSGETTKQYTEVARTLIAKMPESWQDAFFLYLAKHNPRDVAECRDDESFPSRSSQQLKKTADLSHLINFLEKRRVAAGIRLHYRATASERSTVKRFSDSSDRYSRKRPYQTPVFMTATERCAICQAPGHTADRCNWKTSTERHYRARKEGVCLKCLQHQFDPHQPCPVAKSCRECGLQHHHVVCLGKNAHPKDSRPHGSKRGRAFATMTGSESARVYLSLIPAVICVGGRRTPVQVILDSAAEVSLVTSDKVKQSNSPSVRTTPLDLFGVTDGLRCTDQLATLTLESVDGSFQIDITAYVVPQITSGRVLVPSAPLLKQARDKDILVQVPPPGQVVVNILVGQDWLFPFLAPEIVPLGPYIGALKSKLGWYIAGREGEAQARGKVVQMTCQQICQDLAKIYDYIEPEELRPTSGSARPVTIDYDPEKVVYTVNLPRRPTEGLGDNFRNAWAQVMALRRKLKANGQYDLYDQAIKEYMVNGYAEKAPPKVTGRTYYTIPHHAVIKKDAEKTKVRVVYNASSTVPGALSLNQCLEKGEPINADIWAVTIRFRLARIVLVTDLVKAFSQIRIASDDRDLLRYLWFENPDDASPTVYRMTSVIFGATSSPHLLGAVLQHHTERFRTEFPAVTAQMGTAMYMDDGIFAANDVSQAEEIMSQAESFFAKASFALHPWLTNDIAVQSPRHSFGNREVPHKNLGMSWIPKEDTVQVKPVEAETGRTGTTRRQALSVLSRFYDPVSLFAPLKTRIRLFIRDLATPQGDWSSSLTEQENRTFGRLLKELEQVAGKKVPRGLTGPGLKELHVFCDASPQAMGAVAYLVDTSSCERLLLCAKLKLAPKKFATRVSDERMRAVPEVTVPRLELMAAVMAARLVETLLLQLPRETPVALYTDSSITLHRIQGDSNRQEPFEMRRLQVIHELTDVGQWHHIRTDQNPADLPTRDRTTRTWIDKPLWWQGPDAKDAPLAAGMTRVQRSCFLTQVEALTEEDAKILEMGFSEAIQAMEKRLKQTDQEGNTLADLNHGRERPLSPERYATLQVMLLLQKVLFPQELGRLKAGKPVHERSRLRLLNPFLDEWGLIRSRRPAQPQEVDWETRHPIVLAPHAMVRDFVRSEHRRMGHAGEANTRSHLAQYFHIVGARRLIKAVIRPCRECNIQRGRPFRPPEPTLPAFRTRVETRPFQYSGIDYFGPLKVKGASKVYGLLITCAVTRAIHIEVVTSLAAAPCLNALLRFFARRGVPTEIHSDNATTFDAVNRALSKIAAVVEELSNREELRRHHIRWTFQTPRAPWFGAFFERMVGVSKRVLQQTQLRHSSNMDDIRTIVSQVEAIVNSRPLIEADDDGRVALTPAHFLTGTSLLATPPFPGLNKEPVQGSLLKHYEALCETRALLQSRLQKEYLVELRKHHRVRNPTRAPRIGEQVLVSGEEGFEKDRFAWPIARIMDLMPDADGHIRRAIVEVAGRTLERPVKSLIPLEGVQEVPPPPGPGNVADMAQTTDGAASTADGVAAPDSGAGQTA